jgi:hypothetical protein
LGCFTPFWRPFGRFSGHFLGGFGLFCLFGPGSSHMIFMAFITGLFNLGTHFFYRLFGILLLQFLALKNAAKKIF